MRKICIYLAYTCIILFCSTPAYSQRKTSAESTITSSDLESYVSFLASPLLKGRKAGEEGLEIAAHYLASEAKLAGLLPGSGTSYFQPYSVLKRTIDPAKTDIRIISEGDTAVFKEPFYQLIPTGPTSLSVDGEIVFAGYGIKSDKYKYNDFAGIATEGKILLIMDRAPMSEDGAKCQFSEPNWSNTRSFQMKLPGLMSSKAKAIFIVADAKSGFMSFSESSSGLSDYLSSTTTLKGEKEVVNTFMQALPKIVFINRSVADGILKGTGHTLEELQKNIDATLTPNSFVVSNKLLILNVVTQSEEKILNNIAGYIEGRDPVLKNEVVVFSAHYDHIGGSGNKVNSGADDNASGCAALLSMAKAFSGLDKKPLRSLLFLWVSGEEIGLFGSQSYVNNPLFPLDKTIADLNMDMIGRVKGVADSSADTPMTGPNSIFVITDNQSKELLEIANAADRSSDLDFDYSLSGKNHPLQLFARSDHYNFVKKDIPILFFSSGLHTDYHTPRDVTEKIDFRKMQLVTRTMYDIGYTIANKKERLVVDNPYSLWGKSK